MKYTPLRSCGIPPEDFTSPPSEVYANKLGQIEVNKRRRERRYEKKFYKESSFDIHELLMSGYVLYNDSISQYISKIADILLEKEPELRAKLRFYVVRSDVANAFTTQEGIIFVNTGLLANLNNEAELAFILAHEISHFRLGHPLKGYVLEKKKEYYDVKSTYDGVNIYQISSVKFSQDLESEADKEGLQLLQKTKYNIKDVKGVFKTISGSALSFGDIKFEAKLFETGTLVFSDSARLDSVYVKTDSLAYQDDNGSTHPSDQKRDSMISNFVSTYDANAKQKWMVSESRFNRLRDVARFESIQYQVEDFRFCQAIFNALIMLERYPEDPDLELQVARSLYYISELKRLNKFDLNADAYAGLGNLSSCFYFFDHLSLEEINSLAIHAAWDQLKKEKNNYSGQVLSYILGTVLATNSIDKEKVFASYNDSTPAMSSLRDIFKAPDFVRILDLKLPVVAALDTACINDNNSSIGVWRKQVKGLGIDTIILADPLVFVNDVRRIGEQELILEADIKRSKARQALKKNAEVNKLSCAVLDPTANRLDTALLNDMTWFNQWLNQYEAAVKTGISLLPDQRSEQLQKKYGTSKIAWTVMFQQSWNYAPEQYDEAKFYFSFLIYPALPYIGYRMFKKQTVTVYYFVIYDFVKRKKVYTSTYELATENTPGLMNTLTGELIYKVKKHD